MAQLDITSWTYASSYFGGLKTKADRRTDAKTKDQQDWDNSDLVKQLEEGGSDWSIDKVDGGRLESASASEVLAELQRWFTHWETQMNNAWTELSAVWTSKYTPHINGPKTLYDQGKAWEDISEDLAELSGRIGQVKFGTTWQGPGADAYRAIVPKQEKATSENGVLIGTAGTVLFNASAGTQALYLSAGQCFEEIKTRYDALPGPGQGVLGYRMKSLRALYEAFTTFMGGDLLAGWQSWHGLINESVELMSDHDELDPVFVGGSWPKSTSDGDISDAEPGTGQPAVPSTPPPATPDPDSQVQRPQTPAPAPDLSGVEADSGGNEANLEAD